MNYLRLFSSISLLISSFIFPTTNPAQNSLTKKVEQHSLSLISWHEEEWPHESFNKYLERAVEYQRNPQEFRKRRVAFKLLNSVDSPPQKHHILGDTTTWTDLSLFSGTHDPAACLVDKIHRTQTNMGRAYFSSMLANLTSDIAVLEQRKAIARELIGNQSAYDELHNALERLGFFENIFLSFWLSDVLEQAAQRHYFSYFSGIQNLNDRLNRNPIALEVGMMVDHQLRITDAITSAAAAVILPLYALSVLGGLKPPKDMEDFALELKRGGTHIALMTMAFGYIRNKEVQRAASRGAIIGDGILYGFSTKRNFEWARDNILLDIYLQEKLIEVARYVEGLKKIDAVVQANPLLCSILSHGHELHAVLHELPKISDELKQLFELLETDTFQGESSLFSRTGRVLAAYKLMHSVKDQLTKAVVAAAEIDSYLSIAKLYKEFEHSDSPFCFVNFIQQAQPHIEFNDFWNPFIDPKKVVVNSLTLPDKDGRANVILTGPNAGGKSTILKALALNVILSQSFGIAAARFACITPFHTVATYLNISDDIASGNSLFKAEVLRAHTLIENVKNLGHGEFSFIAIDEMFSGTSPEEGRAAAYSVAKHLGQFPNSIAMIATHFPLLTRLESDTNNFCTYKVSVNLKADGTISYPFILEPGISDQHVAIDILQSEGFDSQILDDARAQIGGQ